MSKFKVGDCVRVVGEGGKPFIPYMKKFIDLLGYVERVTEDGNFRVRLAGSLDYWIFPPECLVRLVREKSDE